jgi:hypothetical protein
LKEKARQKKQKNVPFYRFVCAVPEYGDATAVTNFHSVPSQKLCRTPSQGYGVQICCGLQTR